MKKYGRVNYQIRRGKGFQLNGSTLEKKKSISRMNDKC
jgi:hypothetical protein